MFYITIHIHTCWKTTFSLSFLTFWCLNMLMNLFCMLYIDHALVVWQSAFLTSFSTKKAANALSQLTKAKNLMNVHFHNIHAFWHTCWKTTFSLSFLTFWCLNMLMNLFCMFYNDHALVVWQSAFLTSFSTKNAANALSQLYLTFFKFWCLINAYKLILHVLHI